MTAGYTELLTKQVALTGTETDLGALFGESTGKIRLSIPDAATSSVWLGKKGVSTSDDEYMKGTQTQLPTTSLRGWYAITNGASVTVTITMATGGVDAPDWITAGTNGSSSGGGGGGGTVAQGTGNTANPWTMQGVNGGAGERLATQADQATTNSKLDALSAQLPASLGAKPTANSFSIAFPSDFAGFELANGTNWAGKFIIGDGTNAVAVLNSAPSGSEYGLGTRAIGNTATTNAAASQADGHSESIGSTGDADTALTVIGRLKKVVALLAGGLPSALGGGGGLKVDGSGTPLPINGTVTANAGTGNFAGTNAINSQADGHSETIGATTDADTANTLIGRAKKIVSLLAGGLPAALGAGGGLKVDGSGTALPVDTELPAAAALADNVANPTVPSIGAFISVYDPNASPPWQRARGSTTGGVWVQGAVGNGVAWSGIEKPQLMAGADSAGGGQKRVFLTDASGRQVVVATGSDGATPRTFATTFTGMQFVTFDPSNCGPFGDLIAEGKTPILSRHWVVLGTTFDPQQDEIVTQANGATVTISSARLTLTSGTTNGADACYRTVKVAQYRAGQGFVFRWTAAFTTGVANSTQEYGFGNGANGGGGNAVAFGYNGTSFGILHRNGGSSTWVAQSSWNGDKCNGSGASGFTLSPTNLNVFAVHVPFLGAGDIRFFVQHPATGQWLLCHTIQYAGSSTSLEFTDPVVHFYGRVVSTGSTTNLVAYAGSAAAFVVGAVGNDGQQWAVNNTPLSVNGTAAVLSIRCATSVNGALNNTPLRIRSIACSTDGGNTSTTFVAAFGVTLGGTPAFAAFPGKSATTADNGVTLTSATTIGTVDVAGTTVTGGDPIWNACAARTSTAIAGELEENPVYIFPGQTLTFYAITTASANIVIAVNGTVG